MAFKCHVCKKLFMNNLEFMKHLHLHVETDRETAIDMADLTQCKFCYKDFDSEQKAQAHTNQAHFKKDSPCACLICNSGFPQPAHLIHHMTKVHVKAEMPYQCQICGQRASQHRDIIEHFQETHDRTDKLQCPLCLKTYSLYGDKGYNSNNAVSFMQHLQKHEDIKNRNQLNCRKCCLKFIDDKSLKTHLTDDHVSFKDFDNIETYQYVATDTPIKMPRPDEKQLKVARKKSLTVKPLPQQAAFAAQNLEDMAIYGVVGDRCCECDRSMTLSGHYVAYLCCTKCRYSSCCAKAMSVHVQLFHSGSKPVFDLGKSIIMQEPMFCVCGFSAHSGNKLAKHIGTHGCKSAYPNLEEAIKARVAGGSEGQAATDGDKVGSGIDQELEKGLDPRISITEAHKSSEKAAQKEGSTGAPAGDTTEETAGPLAFLGLQRKGSREEEKKDEDMDVDKDSKTDEEKEDKTDEEKEGKMDEEKDGKTDEEKKGKTDEVIEKEKESDKSSDNFENEVNMNKENEVLGGDKEKEEGEMDVDKDEEEDKEEEDGEEQKQPKEAGSVLFGTLFKYMGEKKDEESKDDKAEGTVGKKDKDCSEEEPTSSLDNLTAEKRDEEATDHTIKKDDNTTSVDESNVVTMKKDHCEGGSEDKTGTEESLDKDGGGEENNAEKTGEAKSVSQTKDEGQSESSADDLKAADETDEKMES